MNQQKEKQFFSCILFQASITCSKLIKTDTENSKEQKRMDKTIIRWDERVEGKGVVSCK